MNKKTTSRSLRIVALLAAFAGLQGFGRSRASAEKPYLMAAIGDSITAASVADLAGPRESFLRPDAIDWIPPTLIENKATYSWASGERLNSHILQLNEWLARHGDSRSAKVLNVSVPGALASEIGTQAQQVVDTIASGNYQSLKYVTIMIGANDACGGTDLHGTPNDQVKASLLQTLAKLAEIRQADRIPVLVSGLPRIPDLGKPEIVNARGTLGVSCARIRTTVMKTCKKLMNWTDSAGFLERMTVVEQKNDAIEAAVREASARFPNLDLHYDAGLTGLALTPSLLALDCFHPSQKGQQGLADLLWAAQPWFK